MVGNSQNIMENNDNLELKHKSNIEHVHIGFEIHRVWAHQKFPFVIEITETKSVWFLYKEKERTTHLTLQLQEGPFENAIVTDPHK